MYMMRVSTSQFREKMGRYMKAVRNGKEVIVTDRDQPVARLIPFRREKTTALEVNRPRDPTAPPLGSIKVRGIDHQGRRTMEMLLEDRKRR